MAYETLRLAFIGAGFVNFGGGEGPWDHASRIEELHGVRVVAICDANEERARAQLEQRRHGRNPEMYAGCEAYGKWEQMLDTAQPDAVFIGLPPDAHGKIAGHAAVEVGCAARGVHLFLEKPLAVGDIAQVQAVSARLREARSKRGTSLIASVGYMLRYSNMVNHLRDILQSAAAVQRAPRVFMGRYCAAYSQILAPAFWDIRRSGGPIIEQATHVLDLARYLMGEVDLASVTAQAIMSDSTLGILTDMPADTQGKDLDADVPPAQRIARATIAGWRFTSGALGTLSHGVLQQGKAYEAEVEVWGDGLKAAVTDPYSPACELAVRHGDFRVRPMPIEGVNDPYLEEDRAFIEAVREDRPELIKSPYDDAVRTFELSCRITECARAAQATE